MSQLSKIKNSRNAWKMKAIERAEKIRYLRKELNRIKKEREILKKEQRDSQSCQCPVAYNGGVVFEHKVDLVFLALQLFLVARIGFRAVTRVMGVLAPFVGIPNVPCPQTIINWVTRLSLVRIQSPPVFQGLSHWQQGYNGAIWMIDMSIALGTGKILAVLSLNAHHHQLCPGAPGFAQVHCIAVSVANSWTGSSIAEFLKSLIAVTGRPVAYLKDGGRDLQKAIRLLNEQELGSLCIDDISHVIANLLKHWYLNHPMFDTFISACGHVSGKLKQTILACLAPPKVQTKARFMNVHRLITWADQLLKLSTPGRAAKNSVLSKLRICLDTLPSCRSFIRKFMADVTPLLECQKILKTEGLSHNTLAKCLPLIQEIPSAGLRRDFNAYLDDQLDIAKQLGLDEKGIPVSSDQIESLFGLAKQHGTGQMKDADRIAIRLPALCGAPTLAEAHQVLKISVADQNEIRDSLSLIKQRRQILGNPDCLESLGTESAQAHITLIPKAKNRSKNVDTDGISACYPISCGLEAPCLSG